MELRREPMTRLDLIGSAFVSLRRGKSGMVKKFVISLVCLGVFNFVNWSLRRGNTLPNSRFALIWFESGEEDDMHVLL